MADFTIKVVTGNPNAREKLREQVESQLLGGIDYDETTDTFYDASIICTEDGVDLPEGLVWTVELDGASNNAGGG